VRQAQRTYQKRKDTVTATEKRRVDELLQLLQDLSSDVESLLQAASNTEIMHRGDEVSKNVQRLWTTYNTVISSEHVQPELRLLQVKNTKRMATHQEREVPRVPATSEQLTSRHDKSPVSLDPAGYDPGRYEGMTIIGSFTRTAATEQYMAGRSVYDIVKQRQAALKEAERQQVEH